MNHAASSSLPMRIPFGLSLTAFVQGAAVLVIEVLGARMLTPYFGTSHFVWTAQITVTLVALTIGYALGARASSGSGRAQVIRWGLLVAGGSTGITPLIAERVSYASYRVPLSLGAMLTSLTLFGLPLAALAALSPCLVGAAASEHDADAGKVAGRMAAVSTAGSVAGVLIVAYLCIPYAPTSDTMYGLAALLLVAAVIFASRQGDAPAKAIAVLLGGGIALAAGRSAFAPPPRTARFREIYRTYSPYSTLQVWRAKDSAQLALSTNLAFQNYYDPVTHEGTDAFAHVLAALAHMHAPRASRALLIGLGVGVVPRLLARDGVQTEAFEIDPQMPALAQKYFEADLGRIALCIGDGRRLLSEVRTPVDILLLDAFHGDSTPAHLLSREAFQEMRTVMRPDGVLLANMATDPEQENLLLPVVERTLQTVFRYVRVYDAHLGNCYVAASDHPFVAVEFNAIARVPEALRDELSAVIMAGREPAQSSGAILTDDFNPADILVARVAEAERRIAASASRSR